MSVGQSPQASVAVSGTVAAWPGVVRLRVKVAAGVPGGRGTAKPPGPLWLPISTVALVAGPKARVRSALPAPLVVTVTCRRPGPLGAVVTLMGGRGAQATGAGVGVVVAAGAAGLLPPPVK